MPVHIQLAYVVGIVKDSGELAISDAIAQVIEGNYPLSPSLARYLFKLVSGSVPPRTPNLPVLSDREQETLRCIAQGMTYDQTARTMGIALSTVQSHIRNLYRKLDVNSHTQAAAKARDQGLI